MIKKTVKITEVVQKMLLKYNVRRITIKDPNKLSINDCRKFFWSLDSVNFSAPVSKDFSGDFFRV